ncbi:MAG: nickel-dependent lactate racemase [Proteobacteria bacterium]|nr:nickel-dependent lactate racemase [Pseudomonadota bacterium]MBU1584905.1 nickel-dependent lactate racemase [Pseudomonadota bacterium]MBU2454884.1 nickel-dependent lactate racemase [Pseudomonadota bacterium]MBU2630929.1 nickel-dependent lactate racemase [Pseudomonadota bacterium]
MKIKLEKGQTFINIKIPDDSVFDILMGKDVPGIGHDKIKQIISKGIKTHSPEGIQDKKIVVIIPDNTRLWARGDIFVPQIVKTLFDLGVKKDNVKIIIALGTHDDMPKAQFSQLAGTFCLQNVDILNSANKNQDRLVYIGQTYKKTSLYITKEAVDADHIIIFGGILHHMAAGFGGGRKYILPGIAGYDSIQQNHSLAMRKDGSPHPMVRQAKLWGNPINEDINEAADLFLKHKTCTYVAIAANGMGDIFHVDVGPLHPTFMNGCKKLDQACCIKVAQKGDFALISAGGHRTDQQLYQATKALFNAVSIVKEGGSLLFVAGCSQGVGNKTFSSVLKNFKNDPKTIGKQLVQDFNMPAYVAFRVIDVLNRFDVTLMSDFLEPETRELGFNYTNDIDGYINRLNGKGYIIPFAENILPVLNTP